MASGTIAGAFPTNPGNPITPTGAGNYITVDGGGFYRFGKVVLVQILATTTRAIAYGTDAYASVATNAPTPALSGVALSVTTGQLSNPVPVAAQIRDTTLRVKSVGVTIPQNQYLFITGMYIAQ